MSNRFCLAILFILLPIVHSHSQTKTTAHPAVETPEVVEAARLAVEVAELYKHDKFREALPLARRSLQIREKAFTPADEALRTAIKNLGEVYLALGRYGDAEPLFQRLIKSYEEFAPADTRLVRTLQRLAFKVCHREPR